MKPRCSILWLSAYLLAAAARVFAVAPPAISAPRLPMLQEPGPSESHGGAGSPQASREDAVAAVLSQLSEARAARAAGNHDLARERILAAIELALPVLEQHVEPEHLCLCAVGHFADGIGEFAGARRFREAVVEMSERTLPDDHPELLAGRQNLAGTMYSLGDLQGARALLETVLLSLERTLPEEHPEVLGARGNLAVTLGGLGDLQGARALSEQVLEVYGRTLPEDHPDLQRARLSLAGTIRQLGELQGARALEEAVLAARERTLPEDHPSLLAARLNLASTLALLGDRQGARVLQEAVLIGFERTLPEDHPNLLKAQMNLALTIKALGNLDDARVLEEAVLAGFGRTLPANAPDLLGVQGNLASTIEALGDLQGARALREAVLSGLERTLPEGHPDVLTARQNLALTFKALDDLHGARVLEEAVLAARERTLPEDHHDLLAARGNLAITCARLASAARGGNAQADGGGWPRALSLAAETARGAERGVRAALLGSSSREAEERVARVTSWPLDQALSFALGYGQFEPVEDLSAEALRLSESGRGAGLAAARLARIARGSAEYGALWDEARAASAKLAALAQAGADANEFHAARSRREAAERRLMRLAEEWLGRGFAGLEVDLPLLATRLGAGEGSVAFRRYTRWWLEEVGRGAEAGEPGVKSRSLESLGAFVLARKDDEAEPQLAFVDLGAIDAIDGAVREWRAVIGVGTAGHVRSGAQQPSGPRGIGLDEVPTSSGSAEARALRRLVWDPLVPALGTAERVSVALDDVLHLVPLEALQVEEEEQLLGERWRIETRTSFWELLAEDPPVDPSGTLLALGDVAYGAEPVAWKEDEGEQQFESETPLLAQAGGYGGVLRGSPSEGGFTSLAHTGPEVRTIAALLRESAGSGARALVLEGPHASLASLGILAPKTRWLHLATHGWFAPDRIRSFADRDERADSSLGALGLRTGAEETVGGMSPLLLCGLALAGSNLAPDFLGRVPGLLTAEELSDLDLANCELAVLSACDTNVGRLARAGQGVASLQKALHMAGARSVITSLWKVDDAATAMFFERFYTRLWHEGLPKSEALWRTKLDLRAAGHPPRDWAAWVLTGDPN